MFSTSLTVALVALPFVAKSVLAGDCVRSYVVQEGDICDSISGSQSVSTYQLATINAGYIDDACSNLQVGATICLGYEGEDCDETYTVVANDTCEGIASSQDLDEATLYNNNPNIFDDCSNIYIGEVLAVCKSVIVPPAGTSIAATGVPTTATAVISASSEAAAVTTHKAAAATTTATSSADYDDSGDEDDESLPWCDEL